MMDSAGSLDRAPSVGRPVQVALERRALQQLFLERLDRLARRRAICLEHDYPRALRLLNHALYSSYWDCARLGVRSEARRILGLPAE